MTGRVRRKPRSHDPERVAALAGALHRLGRSNNPTSGSSLFARTTMGRSCNGRRVRVSMLDLSRGVLHVEVPLPGGFGGTVIGLVPATGDPEREATLIDQIATRYFSTPFPEETS